MNYYAGIIQAAEAEAAQAKAAKEQAAEFLHTFVCPQMIMAKEALESFGIKASVDDGPQGCTLAVDGVSPRLVFTAAAGRDTATAPDPMPIVKILDGYGLERECFLDTSEAIESIHKFLEFAIWQLDT